MKRLLPPFLFVVAALVCADALGAEKLRPLMRDFMGLCVHTVNFKPDLYAPVTRMIRDYHPLRWDVEQDTGYAPKFPFARNGVEWGKMYGAWVKAGYRIDASIMFDDVDPKAWKDPAKDAYQYGRAFGAFFGPSGNGLVEAAEIGNEPGKYDDATYRTLLEGMARGLRDGSPGMQIVTCAANLGVSGRYSKSVDLLRGLESLYDVVNIHVYPEVEGWPTWRRSFPEDSRIEFLRNIGHVLKWRDQNAPAKEVWLTEFGWDASTQPAPSSGTFAKWVGSTETQQALWTVRGYLVLAASGLDRAYLYYFNDDDTPHVHGSSGLTRRFQPKPAFHAVAHLQKALGECRFIRAVREDAQAGYVYEFAPEGASSKRVLAVWLPQGEGAVSVPVGAAKVVKAERTPLTAAPAQSLELASSNAGAISVPASEAPVFIWLE